MRKRASLLHLAEHNECVIVRAKMYHCKIPTGIMVTSCVYSFPSVQSSVLFYLLMLQCLFFLVSPKVLNTYRNPSTGKEETRFVLAQRMPLQMSEYSRASFLKKIQPMRLRFLSPSSIASLHRIVRFYEKCFPFTNHLTGYKHILHVMNPL